MWMERLMLKDFMSHKNISFYGVEQKNFPLELLIML